MPEKPLLADVIHREEYKRRKFMLFQYWEGIYNIVLPSIIERDQAGRTFKCHLSFYTVGKLLKRQNVETTLEYSHLAIKSLRIHHDGRVRAALPPFFGRKNTVVHKDDGSAVQLDTLPELQ